TARAWAESNFPSDTRNELTRDLEALSKHYATRASQIYAQMGRSIDRAALLLALFSGSAVVMALFGSFIIARSIARPLASITRVTEAVAAGDGAVAVPFSDRGDEIGALARSIAVFQKAMNRNVELNRTVVEDADARTRRQEQMSGEITRFSAEV